MRVFLAEGGRVPSALRAARARSATLATSPRSSRRTACAFSRRTAFLFDASCILGGYIFCLFPRCIFLDWKIESAFSNVFQPYSFWLALNLQSFFTDSLIDCLYYIVSVWLLGMAREVLETSRLVQFPPGVCMFLILRWTSEWWTDSMFNILQNCNFSCLGFIQVHCWFFIQIICATGGQFPE